MVLINNSTCRVYVFQGKQGAWEPVYEWLCCVGTTSETDPTFGNTVRGDFYIRKKGYRMGSYPYEYYWSEFYINAAAATESWGEGQRFHSVLKTGGPNSADYDGRLGYACTHGCVRLATANAKWIYDNCPLYTRVISY
jgi:lipoprotein-anchoring transpeptidase ErfK/SrfK